MATEQLENTLKELERVGTLIGQERGRQVWRFSQGDKAYRLNFYPRGRGNRAIAEFRGLTQLQRSQIPAVHAIALLAGFRIKDELGDAVVVGELENAQRLDRYLADFESRGEPVPGRRELAMQVQNIALQLGRAKLGHTALGLDQCLIQGRKLFLTGGEHVHTGGLRMKDVLRLGHSAGRFASTTEMLRAWQTLGPGSDMPRTNAVSRQLWKSEAAEAMGENDHFGRLNRDGWTGWFTKSAEIPRAWAPASRWNVTWADWDTAWPVLLAQIESDQLEILKRGDSGDVLGGEVILAGKPIAVIVKRPRRKHTRQIISDLFRPSRAKRTWIKTWKMLVRDVPCEWPMLLMEKRTLGYVTDSIIVFDRVDGPTLAEIKLDEMSATSRDRLFDRVGRILRRIETLGFTHMDAKSTNWMIFSSTSPARPQPVLVDLDGVRHYRWETAGILRLLRAMKQHPQYTVADSLALCTGYAPRSVPMVENSS